MDGSRRASASITLAEPSVEPSSTTRISFAIGTAMTRFNNSAIVGRSLKQGTITERTGASGDVAKTPKCIRERQQGEVALGADYSRRPAHEWLGSRGPRLPRGCRAGRVRRPL